MEYIHYTFMVRLQLQLPLFSIILLKTCQFFTIFPFVFHKNKMCLKKVEQMIEYSLYSLIHLTLIVTFDLRSNIPHTHTHAHMHARTHTSLLLLTRFMHVALSLHPSVNTINLNHVFLLIFNSCASFHKSVYCNSLYLACFMYVNKPSTLRYFFTA